MLGTGFIRLSKLLFRRRQPGPILSNHDIVLRSLVVRLGLIATVIPFVIALVAEDSSYDLPIVVLLIATIQILILFTWTWVAFDWPRFSRYGIVFSCAAMLAVIIYLATLSSLLLATVVCSLVYLLAVALFSIRQLSLLGSK